MTVEFEISGQRFTALNGGPHFKFNEAISLEVNCDNQEEIDYFWDRLSDGGEIGPCGWLKDRFGLSWQVTPVILAEMLSDPDQAKCTRVTNAFLQMGKLDIETLEKAYAGE
jgi:predicted 3-demethylubiquinone-9 3-methyltransferase (glyoxalase superfamily)